MELERFMCEKINTHDVNVIIPYIKLVTAPVISVEDSDT